MLPPTARVIPSRRLGLAASLACLLVPTVAAADGDAPTPAWQMDPDALQELQARGLGQYRGDPVPVPADAPRMKSRGAPKAGGSQGRIFVNFDGAQLSSGSDNSINNVTQIGQLAGNFAAYGEGAKRDAVMQAVRDDWAAYNVIVVDSRPASGNYTMNMTGPTNPFGGGVLGIAPLDCNDQQTPNNITYAFHSVNDSFDASTTATTIGQEVAHSFGLEHVDEPGDIMNPYNAGGDPAFTDQCLGIVGGLVCGSQHAAECGSQSQQNSHRELLTLFGPSAPDTQSPTVSITSPEDGATFDVGADFEIVVEAADDQAVDQVVLFNDGEQIETDGSSPYGWTVNNAPAGTYVFHVEATDPAGNVSSSDVVTITVGEAPAEGGSGGAESAGTDGGEATGAVDGGDADSADAGDDAFDDGAEGALPPGFGLDRSDEGCACATAPTGPTGGGMWAAASLLGLALRRRRARRR